MEIFCTRPGCSRPLNQFSDLDNPSNLKTIQQKFCTSCGMPLILGGRYLPLRLLGRGGFGAAFLAKDRYTPTFRSCVVKQFQPSGDLSPEELEIAHQLFEREATVLEQLGHRHPQIPDLYAFFPLIVPRAGGGTSDQFFYLVQEFIEGQTLEEELEAKKLFSETEVRAILENLLQVLSFVHSNGSIHRDIKPSNIMRDQKGQIYLLDFGAVKQITASPPAGGGSTGIFSLGFAPPEQMSGSQVYPSTDLYSLAVTCLHLLTGEPPQNLYDAYTNTWKWKSFAPQTSPHLSAILERMLLATPKDRFASAEAVLAALNPPPVTPAPRPSPAATHLQVVSTPRFSLGEVLAGAAFTGFEGALLAIALSSFLTVSPGIIVALVVTGMAGVTLMLHRRWLEGKDLPVIALLSLGLMLIPPLQKGLAVLLPAGQTLLVGPPILTIGIVAVISALVAVAATSLFRLIYQLLSLFFPR